MDYPVAWHDRHVLHPARFDPGILNVMAGFAEGRVLDPFAGTGRVHQLMSLSDTVTETWGVEIEPEWAAQHERTIVGNALALPFKASTFDSIVTSPCYGNRFADHHNAQDGSTRRSYTHDLGRPLHPDNAGTLHFGKDYQNFHTDAWYEVIRVLRPGGRLVLNVSDFIRNHQPMPVCAWHRVALRKAGLTVECEVPVVKVGYRYGANRDRVPDEYVIVFDKGVRPPSRRWGGHRHQKVKPPMDGQMSIYDYPGVSA